jgi:hypothetical protein
MTDFDELLDRIETPPADVADDVARGEHALRRRRRWQVAAVALSVVAVAGAGVALTGSHGSPGADPGFSAQSGTGPATTSPSAKTPHDSKAHRRYLADQRAKRLARKAFPSSMAAIRAYHDVLAEHLDPEGDLLAAPSNEQGGPQTLGSKLDWNHGGMLEIVVANRWNAASGFYLLENAGMTPTTYDGHEARVSTTGDDTVVSVLHDDGTIVTLIASATFGNNGTSAATTYLTQHRLLEAAADARLQLPPNLG